MLSNFKWLPAWLFFVKLKTCIVITVNSLSKFKWFFFRFLNLLNQKKQKLFGKGVYILRTEPHWPPMTHRHPCQAKLTSIWSHIILRTISNKSLWCQIYPFLVNIYLSTVVGLHNRSHDCIERHFKNP